MTSSQEHGSSCDRVNGRDDRMNIRRIWYGKSLEPPTYRIAGSLFLRLLGFVYLVAFVSLWSQIEGLVGENGVLPAKDYLASADRYYSQQVPPMSPAWNVPTLTWLNSSDGFLNCLCGAGSVLSLFLIFGVLPLPALMLLWLCYLSLFHVGQDFLSFQWDILLLETGVLAIFLPPTSLRSRLFTQREPPRIAIWLMWFLLFRLMFRSGLVKLIWNDTLTGPDGIPVPNAWESLTALDYHYWTQPLPIWTSWYAAQLPTWFHKLSVVVMLFVELVLPWFMFGPRLLRHIAFVGITCLMLLIAATGNYTFFNLLTILLASTLLDDNVWPRAMRSRIPVNAVASISESPLRSRLVLLVAAAFVFLSIQQSSIRFMQFHFVNEYGLFQRMTETRPEIVIEGSSDGLEWREYSFAWKPGELSRYPRLCAPHQPRLDWQMWFEALQLERAYEMTGNVLPSQMSRWFRSLLSRLLAGEPKVLKLLRDNPFPNSPPTFIRIVLYEYRFTTANERGETGDWWHREVVWVSPKSSLADEL